MRPIKKEGLFKRLKKIEDKNEKQLKAIEIIEENNWIQIQNH